jgi:hypothetical protein
MIPGDQEVSSAATSAFWFNQREERERGKRERERENKGRWGRCEIIERKKGEEQNQNWNQIETKIKETRTTSSKKNRRVTKRIKR